MILYNVTVNVEPSIHEEFVNWLKKTHIPEVLQTGLFVKYSFLRLISDDPESIGTTYAVQYFLKDLKDFVNYTENYSPALQKKTKDRYGDKVVAFRTLLEVLEE